MNKTNRKPITSNGKTARTVAEYNLINYAKAWRRNLSAIGMTPATAKMPEQDKLLYLMIEKLEKIEGRSR